MRLLRREQPIAKELLEQMYVQEKRSMQEIAHALGCSVNKVVYWMDKHGMERRGQDEAAFDCRCEQCKTIEQGRRVVQECS